MARVAEICGVLIRKQVTVHRPVDCVAGRAAFDRLAEVLEDERTLFVRVAFVAHSLLETTEVGPRASPMRDVAVDASNHPLRDSMAFVQLKGRLQVTMAVHAGLLPNGHRVIH